MEIINIAEISVKKEKEQAIRYIYKEVVSSNLKCSYWKFKRKVLQTKLNKLPQYYIFYEKKQCVGYFLMIANNKRDTCRLFPWLACHNGDSLEITEQLEMIHFMKKEAERFSAFSIKEGLEHQEKEIQHRKGER